jgi:eukaryotic-like serine/threonine-protein kinase
LIEDTRILVAEVEEQGDRAPAGETLPLASGVTPPRSRFGRFEAIDVLGKGGMGVVLRAHDPELGRMVAIKVLPPGERRAGAPRLHREAQAMAKLSHPNVVTVYDVGRVDDAAFIAMELVEGTTLRGWLAARQRSWREIVTAFIAAGRGLAAAHAAGLVHRDFKPENVLVGADGRPRVTDFGLVTSGVALAPGDVGDQSAGESLSVRGAVMGTPAYMAPEQWRGADVDARADQFAFCVALWEGLFGERPFAGSAAAELRDNVLAGARREPVRTDPSDAPTVDAPELAAAVARGDDVPAAAELRRTPARGRVPRRVIAVLQRGLSIAAADRFADMPALLAPLDAVLHRRRGTLIAAGATGALAVGALVAVLATRPAADSVCGAATARLGEAWGPERAAQIRATFAAAGAVGSRGAALVDELDAYARRWSAGSVAACRATHVEHVQSPQALDLRTACLESGRLALGALARMLATADAKVIARANGALDGLPDLDACSDSAAIAQLTPLPSTPALRVKIDAARAAVAEAEAARARADGAAALEHATAAVAHARAAEHPPTLALALGELGDVHTDAWSADAAEAAYREQAAVAAEAHDDRLAAEAWIALVYLISEREHAGETAAALIPVAEAAVARAGNDRRQRYRLLMAEGSYESRREDLDAAIARFGEGAALVPDLPQSFSHAIGNIARMRMARDGAVAAVEAAELSMRASEAAYGRDHHETGVEHLFMAQVLNGAGRHREARAHVERAIAIAEAAFGRESMRVADALGTLAWTESYVGDLASARAHLEERIAIHERLHADQADQAIAIAQLASIIADSEGCEAALPHHLRARELVATVAGRDTSDYAQVTVNYALCLDRLKRCDEAVAVVTEVVSAAPPGAPYLPYLQLIHANCVAKDRPRDAVAILEPVRTACAERGCEPLLVGAVAFTLGGSLYDSRMDRARGLALLRETRAAAAAEDPESELVTQIDTWLAARKLE